MPPKPARDRELWRPSLAVRLCKAILRSFSSQGDCACLPPTCLRETIFSGPPPYCRVRTNDRANCVISSSEPSGSWKNSGPNSRHPPATCWNWMIIGICGSKLGTRPFRPGAAWGLRTSCLADYPHNLPLSAGQCGIALVERRHFGDGGSQTALGCIAQLVEQLTLNQRVQGSSPCAPTKVFQ